MQPYIQAVCWLFQVACGQELFQQPLQCIILTHRPGGESYQLVIYSPAILMKETTPTNFQARAHPGVY